MPAIALRLDTGSDGFAANRAHARGVLQLA